MGMWAGLERMLAGLGHGGRDHHGDMVRFICRGPKGRATWCFLGPEPDSIRGAWGGGCVHRRAFWMGTRVGEGCLS